MADGPLAAAAIFRPLLMFYSVDNINLLVDLDFNYEVDYITSQRVARYCAP